jgi:tetratricopeptide (TPR) repeat protein
VYFNGNEAFKEAWKTQLENHTDNYSEIILMYPVSALPKDKTNIGGPFDKAIEKAVKAIKMHSVQTKPDKKNGKQNDLKYKEFMNRTEYNPFLHKAWALMAKSQFHNGDFIAAASTYSYVSRLYETQPEISTPAKIWKARCYAEMEWYYEAEDILAKLNNDQLPAKQIDWFSAVYADFLIKRKQYADAIPYMKVAVKAEENKYQRAREKYLLGQLYATTGQKDLAYKMFEEVAGASVPYALQISAQIRQTEVYSSGNTRQMSKKLERMTKSSKNKNYLDQIYYALGNVYMAVSDTAKAIESYESGVEKSTQGGIAKAMNQIRLGDIYFDLRKYVKAQPNYSEALSQLKKSDAAFSRVSTRSEVLDALVVHAEAVELQDSLLRLSRMTEEERLAVVEKIIEDLIKKEEEEKKKAEMEAYLTQQETMQAERQSASSARQPAMPAAPVVAGTAEAFYFYNKQAVSLGKNTFLQKWGKRKLEDDWRRKNKDTPLPDAGEEQTAAADTVVAVDTAIVGGDFAVAVADTVNMTGDTLAGGTPAEAVKKQPLSEDPKDPQYYLQQIPVTDEDIAAANLIIADGLFNMGVIYKDMLEDFDLAMETFDSLNTRYPEHEKKLDTYHHIYLMHWKREDMATANFYKSVIRAEFPESDLAIAMADPDYEYNQRMMGVMQDSLYQKTYNEYLDGNPVRVREIYGKVMRKYNQSALTPKFMFVNALSFVQTQDTDTFKILLKQLIDKYPNEDVSVLAGEIMKGFQRGLLLGSGDNSLAKSGLFNMRFGMVGGDGNLPDSTLAFTANVNTPHKLIFIFPKGSINDNLLLFTVASFNFGNFMVNDFELKKADISEEIGSLEIAGFNNLSEVMQYYNMIYQTSGYAKELEQTVVIVPVSQENYTTLINGKSLNDYMLFFEEHFSEGNESLIMRWNLDKEREQEKIEEQEHIKGVDKIEVTEKAPLPETEETQSDEPAATAELLDTVAAAIADIRETDTAGKSDDPVGNVYDKATEKADNLRKTYDEIASDPVRGISNLFKKEAPRNAIDEYAEQQEKEEKVLTKQRKKEQKEKDKAARDSIRQKGKEQKALLKKQQAENEALLKAQKKQEKDLAKLKKAEQKQQEADKKRIAKEEKEAQKAAIKQKKEQQKAKEKQRKAEREERAKLRKEQQNLKEAERKEKERLRKEERKAKKTGKVVYNPGKAIHNFGEMAHNFGQIAPTNVVYGKNSCEKRFYCHPTAVIS